MDLRANTSDSEVKMMTITELLERLDLVQYIQLFEDNGIDDLETLTILDKADFDTMNIRVGHKAMILHEARFQMSASHAEIESPLLSADADDGARFAKTYVKYRGCGMEFACGSSFGRTSKPRSKDRGRSKSKRIVHWRRCIKGHVVHQISANLFGSKCSCCNDRFYKTIIGQSLLYRCDECAIDVCHNCIVAKDGCFPLCSAAMAGDGVRVRALLQKKADVNAICSNLFGCAPLLTASRRGHLELVHELLDSSADINIATQSGWTALMRAAHKGHLEVVKLLLAKKSDINHTNAVEETALIRASWNTHFDVVELLLMTNRINVNLSAARRGRSPLHVAVECGNIDIVSVLLDRHADVNFLYRATPNVVAECEDEDDIAEEQLLVKSALIMACSRNSTEIVKLLLANDGEVNITDNYGYSPLHVAAKNGNITILSQLLEKKADVNVLYTEASTFLNKSTPLVLASRNGHFEAVQALLEANAQLVIDDESAFSALVSASAKGHSEVVRTLLNGRADINLPEKRGKVALIEASQSGHIEVVKLLLQNKSDVNLAYNKTTALFEACSRDHMDVVKILVQNNSDVNMTDFNGYTALQYAQMMNKQELVSLLTKQ